MTASVACQRCHQAPRTNDAVERVTPLPAPRPGGGCPGCQASNQLALGPLWLTRINMLPWVRYANGLHPHGVLRMTAIKRQLLRSDEFIVIG